MRTVSGFSTTASRCQGSVTLPRALLALAGSMLVGLPAMAQTAAAPLPLAVRSGCAARGAALYQGCTGCHSLDENDLGPRHRGVVGRRAGTVGDFRYSEALRLSGLIWDEATLDRWLTDPQALVPGTRMYYTVRDAQARADIIAFLRQQVVSPARGASGPG